MSLWLKTLTGYLLIVSVVLQMLPEQKYEQYIKLFTGFLLILLVLQPVLKIGAADDFLESKVNDFVQEQEIIEEQIDIKAEMFRKETEKRQEEPLEHIEVQEIAPIKVEVDKDD